MGNFTSGDAQDCKTAYVYQLVPHCMGQDEQYPLKLIRLDDTNALYRNAVVRRMMQRCTHRLANDRRPDPAVVEQSLFARLLFHMRLSSDAEVPPGGEKVGDIIFFAVMDTRMDNVAVLVVSKSKHLRYEHVHDALGARRKDRVCDARYPVAPPPKKRRSEASPARPSDATR